MVIVLRKVPGFNGCKGIWLFLTLSDRLLVILGFNKFHMDVELQLGCKQLTLGPSIQSFYERN